MYSKFRLAIQEPFSRIVRPYNNAGSFNATVFISMLSGGRAGVSINSPAAANTSLLVSLLVSRTITRPVNVAPVPACGEA